MLHRARVIEGFATCIRFAVWSLRQTAGSANVDAAVVHANDRA